MTHSTKKPSLFDFTEVSQVLLTSLKELKERQTVLLFSSLAQQNTNEEFYYLLLLLSVWDPSLENVLSLSFSIYITVILL